MSWIPALSRTMSLLLLVNTALIFLLGLVLLNPLDRVVDPDRGLQEPQPSTLLQPQKPIGIYEAALLEKPLFHQSRRFIPAAPPVAAEPPPVLPAYLFSGYLKLPGRQGRAMLKPTAGGKSESVSAGDVLEGWTVQEVTPRSVLMQSGKNTVVIDRAGTQLVPHEKESPVASGTSGTAVQGMPNPP